MIKQAIVILLLVLSCSTPTYNEAPLEKEAGVRYAKKFFIEKGVDGDFLVTTEPWPNAQQEERFRLEKPLSKIICTSTSHLAYIEMLGMEDALIGFPNINYVSSEVFRNKAEKGELTDLGPDGSMNLELIIGLNPEAVIAFDMGGESNALNKLQSAGIPVIYNADFLEESPLGRAEYIKFFGALFGKQKKADSLFAAIENEYQRLTRIGESFADKPTVLSGVVYGDTWFLPGGQNWASTFIRNAAGTYLWENDENSGWLELSFETVYEKGNQADFWIGTSTLNSKNELLGQDDRYGSFAAFQKDQVYNYNKRLSPGGGYDFFESGYSRPDLVLADLLSILHPEAMPEYETVYYQKLK